MPKLSNVLVRTLTALFLLPFVFAAIFYLPARGFALVTAGVILLASWEWARLVGLKTKLSQSVYILLTASILGFFYFATWHHLFSYWWLIGFGCIAWVLACIQLALFAKIKQIKYLNIFLGLLILPACWQALNLLCFLMPRPQILLALFFMVWGADTAAFFVGRRFGKHKLAATISPGKTWEGFWGAVVIVMMVTAIVASLLFSQGLEKIASWILLAVITVIAAVVGDLFESVLKRLRGVKDSSQLLPGHGGVLDRLDSLLAAAPIFALGLLVLGLI